MTTKFPLTVIVGGLPVKIVVDPSLEESWGEYMGDEKVIRLSPHAVSKKQTCRETIRHELLHAAFDISGVAYLQKWEEEAVVRCIDNIFHPAWDRIRKILEK